MINKINYQVFHPFPQIHCHSIWQNPNSDPISPTINEDQDLTLHILKNSAFSANQRVLAKQVHGKHVASVSHSGVIESCDGLITKELGLPLIIRTADCAAVMIYAQKQNSVANLHVGWRGAAAGIIGDTILQMSQGEQDSVSHMWVAVGPMLRDCCYQVGPEFHQTFESEYLEERENRLYFNLQAVIRAQLSDAGILFEHTEFSAECTYCSSLGFPSFRRDKARERVINVIEKKEI